MKINVREGESTQQAVLRIGRDGVEDAARDQGYRLGHGEAIFDRAYEKRQEELNTLLGRTRTVGNVALLMLGNGTIITEKEYRKNQELTGK